MVFPGKKISSYFNFEVELILDSHHNGEYNMEFDLNRTLQLEKGETLPMLRFYGWKPWAVSLGANQKESDFDKNKLKEFGFDLVRRPTGGRAVLHANEITYSFVCPLKNGITAQDVYREIHFFLVKGLSLLGADELSFEKAQTNFSEFYKRETVSISCFASSARYEIEWKGKKIVGSAQRVFGNTLLQHGSILLGPGYELIAEVANLKDDFAREILRKHIKNHSISIEEIIGEKVPFEKALESFKKVLC
ncbi:MAG: lipoate--protein ligase family protein [Ignavibacteria bacterium]|nr:lipoate--protein ligase family protein [Ignavibacteria bacterium]